MKYLSFIRPDKQYSIGKLESNKVVELLDTGGAFTDLKTVIAANNLENLEEGAVYNPEEITFLPPILNPDKIICIGLNYSNHIQETGRKQGARYPVIFTRFADTLVGHGSPIIQPRHSDKLDYEGELAVIIGKSGRDIPEAEAFEHIAGYSCFNDASVRDWQRHASHFTPGKNFPGTGGFGPYLVTPDEIEDLGAQQLKTCLNGEIVQDQPVADLIFSVPELIAYISSFTPLRSGDLIVTGTPGGVGYARTPPLWMKPGDTVEVTVGDIGTLVNPVSEE
ncbi:MAG: 5-carboxymethyl-2-hydroxymuconate isomerase [Gammaproteobacteria bacterium]|nr:5-carboxymethyl-2-hydroxymuconate isomerase [Gammaproteobacteria bacterium]